MKFSDITTAKAFLITLSVFMHLTVVAQTGVGSPYSRFGIGLPEMAGSAYHMGQGGLTTAIIDGNVINTDNPASYSFLKRSTFQVGGRGSFNKFYIDNDTSKFNGGQTNEINILFKKEGAKWAFGLGVQPYSSSGYNIKTEGDLDSTSYTQTHEGVGGLNIAHLGMSRVFLIGNTVKNNPRDKDTANFHLQQLSVGFNFNFIFGNILKIDKVYYDRTDFYNTKVTNSTSVKDINFTLGAIHKLPISMVIKDKKLQRSTFLISGITYQIESKLNSTYTQLNQTFYSASSGSESNLDTAYYSGVVKGFITIPQRLAFGLAVRKENRINQSYLQFGVDYKIQDWTKFKLPFGEPSSTNSYYQKSSNLSLGLDFKPGSKKNTEEQNLLKKMTYRMGARFTNTHLILYNTPIKEKAVSLGFNIPIMNTSNLLSIAMEYGRSGTQDNNLIRQNFFNIKLALSLTPPNRERWFYQYKYD
jgi:hypothetical protein